MENKKKKERSVVLLLIIAVLLMTVGFAAYSTTLNINGSVKVSAKPWNVHFVHSDDITKDVVEDTTSDTTKITREINDTDFSFSGITLEKPGDYYQATIKVVNDGSINAALKKITMGGLASGQEKYLQYTVTYEGNTYDATTDGLSIALASKGTHTVVVKVLYIAPENQNDLPSTEQTVNVTGNLLYEDAE